MKNLVWPLLILMFTLSCKNPAETVTDGNDYTSKAVGVSKNEEYSITNLDEIKTEWQRLHEEEGYTDTLINFRIFKGVTEGNINEEYYILTAQNRKGNIKTAAMLSLVKNTFYFQSHTSGRRTGELKINCVGKCNSGCDPVVKVSGGSRYLVCSPCIDCMKTEKEIR